MPYAPSASAHPDPISADVALDCLIVGGGPAGLTAALYLARFGRRHLVVDAGASRAARIPKSHNIPGFPERISGREILGRQRRHLDRYGDRILDGTVTALERDRDGFLAAVRVGRATREIRARRILLATRAADVEPELPGLPDAVRRSLVRYCPICDGYEVRDRRIAVIGHDSHGLAEAAFIPRTYAPDVTLLTLGRDLPPDGAPAESVPRIVQAPVVDIAVAEDRIACLRTADGRPHRFDALYAALGLTHRAELVRALGAARDRSGAVVVDAHNRTTVPGLYAAGGVASGLDQVVVAMGQAAVAATDIHNRCHAALA